MDLRMKDRCIIWGMGNEYETILNQIYFEIYKGNIEVIAIVCRKEDRYCEWRDSFPIILKKEIMKLNFDYIIVSSSVFYKEIKAEAVALGIEEKKIIRGEIFKRTLFDFKMYSKLIKNPVTIITDDCWGGYVYNYLGLEFSSPLINTFWDKDEYARFIQEPLFYLQTDLVMIRDGDLRKGIWPVGRLGEFGKYVQIQFVHSVDFHEAEQQWNRRKKRINQNNILVKMGFGVSDKNVKTYIDAFERCKYRKILFYNGSEDINGKYNTERFIWQERKQTRVDDFVYYDYMRKNYTSVIDVLKLLVGEKDFSREK